MGLGRASGRGLGFGFGRGRGYGYGRGIGGGMGRFSGYSCVKFVFFGFNVFFWLLGCAILGVGIWLQIAKGSYAALSPRWEFFSATALCISAGILVLIVGFFGCCGAIMESKCLLMTYFTLIVLIFLLEIVGGVMAFIYGHVIEHTLAAELRDGIKTKYPPSNLPNEQLSKEQENFKEVWGTLQKSLQCCGVTNYTDWYESKAWPEGDPKQVPLECCEDNKNCDVKDKPEHYYKIGCFERLKTHAKKNLIILGIAGICIGVIQILGLVASMALFCCLRQEKYYDE